MIGNINRNLFHFNFLIGAFRLQLRRQHRLKTGDHRGKRILRHPFSQLKQFRRDQRVLIEHGQKRLQRAAVDLSLRLTVVHLRHRIDKPDDLTAVEIDTHPLALFSRQLQRLANKVISTEDKPSDFAFLDPRLMRTPGVAVSECAVMTNCMGALALESMQLALAQFIQYDGSREEQILANEDKLDTYEDRLGGYLVQISQHGTSSADMRTVSRLLHAIGDFERIGDHALNLQESAKELHEKQLAFSPIAREEVDVLTSLLEDLLNSALRSFQSDDPQMARQVEPLEETMDLLTEEIRSRHIRRLQSGQCTIQLGFILNDLLNNAERVGDHCSNIAVSVIEEQEKQAASHAYLHNLKKNDEFSFQLQQNLSRYVLPAETAEDQPAE